MTTKLIFFEVVVKVNLADLDLEVESCLIIICLIITNYVREARVEVVILQQSDIRADLFLTR